MKTQDKKIIMMLEAFSQEAVLKAFELYTIGISDAFKQTKSELRKDGWHPYDSKPIGKESYFIQGQYWIQNPEMRAKQIQEQLEEHNRIREVQEDSKKANKKYTGQKMNLKKVGIKCPKCNAGMYKQSICGGCKEGKRGYKIRLICENNPDHEVLL